VQIKVITPDRTVLEAQGIQHVLLPAENGELGVLPRHMPMLCSLGIGRIQVDQSGKSVSLATSGGFAEVLSDRITVLADTAELAGEIDVERAEEARRRAEQLLHRGEHVDHLRARAALARAANRLRVASGHG
jgi:F-type H+-transporting ATPase subunit epsilon